MIPNTPPGRVRAVWPGGRVKECCVRWPGLHSHLTWTRSRCLGWDGPQSEDRRADKCSAPLGPPEDWWETISGDDLMKLVYCIIPFMFIHSCDAFSENLNCKYSSAVSVFSDRVSISVRHDAVCLFTHTHTRREQGRQESLIGPRQLVNVLWCVRWILNIPLFKQLLHYFEWNINIAILHNNNSTDVFRSMLTYITKKCSLHRIICPFGNKINDCIIIIRHINVFIILLTSWTV